MRSAEFVRFWRAWLSLLVVLGALCGLPPPGHGQESPPAERNLALYQATAIVTGTDMRQRPLGLAECLTDVLVKVSGRPFLRNDPRVAALAARAETIADDFSYVDPRAGLLHHDDQGTYDRSYELTVRFNPDKVDAALTALGAAPWRGERPVLAPVILVRGTDQMPFLLSVDTPRGAAMRTSLVRASAEYGLGVHVPTEDELNQWGVDVIGFPAPLGPDAPGQLRITGTLDFNVQALGWIGTWRVRMGGKEHDWDIRGVSFDQAFVDMVRGAVELAAGTGTP
jgi:uncharacterized protein